MSPDRSASRWILRSRDAGRTRFPTEGDQQNLVLDHPIAPDTGDRKAVREGDRHGAVSPLRLPAEAHRRLTVRMIGTTLAGLEGLDPPSPAPSRVADPAVERRFWIQLAAVGRNSGSTDAWANSALYLAMASEFHGLRPPSATRRGYLRPPLRGRGGGHMAMPHTGPGLPGIRRLTVPSVTATRSRSRRGATPRAGRATRPPSGSRPEGVVRNESIALAGR